MLTVKTTSANCKYEHHQSFILKSLVSEILLNCCQVFTDFTGVFSVEAGLGEEAGSVHYEELIDGEVNGNWTPQEKALHEARLKAKAKRRLRKSSSSHDSTRDSLSECVSGDVPDPHSPKGKIQAHDRKSRMGKGRGLPKKG